MFYGLCNKSDIKSCQMNYKQQDRDKLLSYLQAHPISTVDAIIEHSGAEKLRIYPILFELNQENIIRAVEETEWGAPMKVILNEV